MLSARLSQLNPWWRGPLRVPAPHGRRRELSRLGRLALTSHASAAVLIVGFRRIGKTTLAFQAASDAADRLGLPHSAITFADFQELDLDGVGPEEVIEVALERNPGSDPKLVLLDEIQFVPHWDRKLRASLRRFADADVRLLVTGSGTTDLRRASGDILLDRAEVLHLEPLTLGEQLELEDRGWDRTQAELEASLDDYFIHGGFPDRRLRIESGPFEIARRLRDLVERYVLEGDLGRRLKIRDMSSFGKCALHFLKNPGVTLDWEKLPGEFCVSRPTFERWIKNLLQAELVVELEPSDQSGRPTGGRKRYSKVYPIDHALAQAYGVPAEEGHGLETLVFRQLRAIREQLHLAGELVDLTYWLDRDRRGRNEIDFRMTGERTRLLVEVKATRAPSTQELEAIAAMAVDLKLNRSILVCRVVEPRQFESRAGSVVHVLPVLEFLRRADGMTSDCEVLFG